MKIKQKLIIAFLLIALFAIVFSGGIAFFAGKNMMETSGEHKVTGVAALEVPADMKVSMIETFFKERRGGIQTAQNYFNIKTNLPILAKFAGNRTAPEFIAAKKMLDGQLKYFPIES